MMVTSEHIRQVPSNFKVCPDCEMINLYTNTNCIACRTDIINIPTNDNVIYRLDSIINEIGDEPLNT
jgi:hypothetical protein